MVVAPGKDSFEPQLRYLTQEKDGVQGAVMEIRTRFWRTFYNNPPFLLQQFRHLYRHVADTVQPDLIHAHISYPCAVVARQLAKQLELPYVISDHWQGLPEHLASHPLRHMTLKALRDAKGILVPTTYMQNQLAGVTQKFTLPAITVVPPAIDPEVFTYKPKTRTEQLQLVALSPLTRDKQLHLLVDAVAQLEELGTPCRLTLIGEGKERKALEARSYDHHAPVRFVGRQTRKQIATHLQDADAVLLSSQHEVYGPYLAEALCTGTPAIVTELPVWKDILAPGFGMQVQPTVSSWTGALKDLAAQEFDHAGIASFAALRYAPAAVAQAIDRIHTKALS